MDRTKFAFAAAVVGCAMWGSSIALAQEIAVADNWCAEAERSLTDRAGGAITCGAVAKRCVRMNNYWCQKHGPTPWRGTMSDDGKDGRRDVDGHAVFESVEWSARAITIDLRAKYRRGLVSAVQIAAAHSPWCDTLGSKAIVSGTGRSCKDGRATPPPNFNGPFCAEPKSPPVSAMNCLAGCNCPPRIAETLVRDLQIDINADLKLFDAAGGALPNLVVVIRNLALQEQGIHVRTAVVNAGIAKAME